MLETSSRQDYSSHISDIASEIEERETPTMQVDVIAELPGSTEKELIRNLEVPLMADGGLLLRPLIFSLKKLGFGLEGALVSYKSVKEDVYVYCGSDPLPESAHVPREELAGQGEEEEDRRPRVELRLKAGLRATAALEEGPGEGADAGKRRTKERKIGFIIERVSLWRKLYNGVPDGSNNIVRYSLEEAAQKVGISKKSLDDYLLQLRFGRKFGFDFNIHRDAKVGVLRAFVKKHKLQHARSRKA